MVQLWARIKSQYGNASSAFSNLSLSSSEEDGNTPNDTVLHHALVRYYTSKNMGIPPWLGVEVADSYNGGYGNPSLHNRPQAHHQNQLPPQQQQPVGMARKPATQSSSLQDIYQRRQQRIINGGATTTGGPTSRGEDSSSRFRPHPTAASRSQPDLPPSSSSSINSDRSDKLRNKLRGAGRANW